MAVKELNMMNLVCERKNLDNLIRDLIIKEFCQFVNSYTEIEFNDFAIGMTEEHSNAIINMENVELIKTNREIKDYLEKIENLSRNFQYEPIKSKEYMDVDVNFENLKNETNNILENFEKFDNESKELNEKIQDLKSLEFIEKVESYDINLQKLMSIENFSVKIGYLSPEKRKRLARNYENISAVIIHLGTLEDKEMYLIISPKSLDVEMSRILRSTNFKEIKIQKDYLINYHNIKSILKKEKKDLTEKLESINKKIETYISENKNTIDKLYSRLYMCKKVDEIKEKVGASENYAYISAWTPKSNDEEIKDIKNKYPNIIIRFKDLDEVSTKIDVPTFIKNNKFFEPFEQLVTMYGVPLNNEIDPTGFFALAYTFLFGAMFGDLGQGIIIILIGIYLSKKKKNSFGGILSRIGIGSMVFGFFYDSFFGYENIISKYLPIGIYFRPMENINDILVLAIGVGIILLTISYIYSIVNKYKNKELGELYFGRNGINGLILFWDLVALVVGMFLDSFIINKYILYVIMLISIVLLIFKEPLNNLLNKDEFSTQIDREYYIESGFNIFETFLSIFSNGISFIRVGAFAINHVGLFLAFKTLANIIGSTSGNIIMFILGNVIIIGLEGLIVFIQGLRLFYYELFSKYYSGDGILFQPEKI